MWARILDLLTLILGPLIEYFKKKPERDAQAAVLSYQQASDLLDEALKMPHGTPDEIEARYKAIKYAQMKKSEATARGLK